MHILTQSTHTLSARQTFIAGREERESLTLRTATQSVDYQRHSRVEVSGQQHSQVSLAKAQGPVLEPLNVFSEPAAPAAATGPASANTALIAPDEQSLHKLRMLLVALGRSVEEIDKGLKSLGEGWTLTSTDAAQGVTDAPTMTLPSLDYHYSATHWQGQSLAVDIQGEARTADGRALQYGLSLEMLAIEYSRSEINLRQGAALTDPLVLNFGGQGVALSAERMRFDLNADGHTEQIATLASHSAFLALDRNNNGRIEQGGELFGALTGDGFSELAVFDHDDNGFIDEADPVFSQLKLWRPDAQGQGALMDLVSAGVGAIGLQRAYGEFDLLTQQGLAGKVRSTGVFLFESGQVGSVQQIDLAT